MITKLEKLTKVMNLGLEITEFQDVDLLLERILSTARELVKADAGSIYIREGNKLKFTYTQNDTLQKKLSMGHKLLYSTFSIPINHESIAGYVAGTGNLLNLPDVYSLSADTPYSFDNRYDGKSGYHTQSVLTIPLKNNRLDIIGILQLINAKDKQGKNISFDCNDEPFIIHFANSAAGAIERAQLTRAIILRMIKMAELRDPRETGAHANRVASYTVEIYEKWAPSQGFKPEEILKNKDILRMAAMLHDVGKVAITDIILKKPARLSEEEHDIIKQHTYLGARLFSDPYSDFDEAASIVALNHHERWDGLGYPGHINPMNGKAILGYETGSGNARGKWGEEIPPYGRLVAIADVFDALSSRRAYKEAWDESKVLDTIKSESGKHFDPVMVDAFFSCLDEIRNITSRFPDES